MENLKTVSLNSLTEYINIPNKDSDTLYLIEKESTNESIESDTWEVVTKEEFEKYIKSYPNKLVRDYYMDWYSWNDFSDGKVWPESMVAMMSDGSYNVPIEYKIRRKETII